MHILQTAMMDALKKKNRLFIEDSNGRAFKSTVVIHAFSTKKSWMALFDFLFDFYKNNLGRKLVKDDPLLDIMIRELQHKLSGDGAEDMDLAISSQVYSFQEGIRKLILLRPVYTRGLFEKLLYRIDDMMNSVSKSVETYEDQLCVEWFKEKLLSIASVKKKERQESVFQKEVAIDYTRIRAKIILKDEDCIQVALPDIRLKTETFSRVFLDISYDGKMIHHQPMSWYGNELGKTLNGITISLPEYEAKNSILDIHVSITCDDEEIYNSEDELTRRMIAFSDKHEISIDKIKRGNYTLVFPRDVVVEYENAVFTEIDSFKQQGMKGYFAELNDGYAIMLNGKLVSFDNENSLGIRVLSPMEVEDFPEFTRNDTNYHFVYKKSTCNIIAPNVDELSRYKLLYNKSQIDFGELEVSITEQGNVFVLPIDDDEFCQIQIIDLETERLIYDRCFVVVSYLKGCFNREFYFAPDDFRDARYEIQCDDIHEIIPFSYEDDEIIIPYRGGFIHMAIPKVQVNETSGAWMMDKGIPAWYIGNIPQNSLLEVSAPLETKIRFFVGGVDIEYDGQGIVSIGNVLQSLYATSEQSDINVEMELSRGKTVQKYVLARVFCKEGFIKNPEFWYQNNKLYWDYGNMFIGKTDRNFILTLFDEKENALDFDIDEEMECVTLPEQMDVGNYRFEVSILSGGLFRKTKEIIAEGNCTIGDENELRFKNRRIVIGAITDEFNEEAGHIEIRTCYIDRIIFKGVQETSEGMCPVYTGILYTDGFNGERYEFSIDSHITNRGVKKMMVNPVRIVYIGNKTLCITDSEGDGLYYYSYYDYDLETKAYALTDHEYTKRNKDRYSTADLYSYQTERN